MADLRTLVAGFLQLSRAAAAAAEPAPTGSTGTRPRRPPSPPADEAASAGHDRSRPTPESLVARVGRHAAPLSSANIFPGVRGHPRAHVRRRRPRRQGTCVVAGTRAAGAPASSAPAPPAAAPASAPMTMTEPVALRQELPPWKPARNDQQQFSGIIEVDIDEQRRRGGRADDQRRASDVRPAAAGRGAAVEIRSGATRRRCR